MVPGQPGPSQRAAGFQAQQKQAGSQSILMPIYTFGIVAFFVFTIVKMLMRKTGKLEAPIKGMPTESDPKFAEKVFGRKNSKEEAKKKLGEFKILHSLFNVELIDENFLLPCEHFKNKNFIVSGWKDHNASKNQ